MNDSKAENAVKRILSRSFRSTFRNRIVKYYSIFRLLSLPIPFLPEGMKTDQIKAKY